MNRMRIVSSIVDQQPGRFVRMVDQARAERRFFVNGRACYGKEGDTVMTALLTLRANLRITEFERAPRAGFCLMGACQDCMVQTEDGARLRACSTLLREDMRLLLPESAR